MKLSLDITKRYKSFTLHSSFETDDMITGLLGSSRCVKTKTLKCIAGLVTPGEGRIILDGKVLFDSKRHINLKAQERRVGYLFQSYALFPTMSVKKNIYTGMHRINSKGEKKERYEEVMHLLKLEGLDEQRPSSLSGGQAQRVALARMLVGDPEVLLLDEPFSALDVFLRERLQFDMKKLLETLNKKVIIVTHSPQEAYRLCSVIIVMKDGKIIREGKTEDVFSNPEHIAVSELLGHRNFFSFEKLAKTTIRLIPFDTILHSKRPIPNNKTILNIPSSAISEGGNITVRTVELLKEEDGNTLLLEDMRKNSIWFKANDKNKTEIKSISIDLDSCSYLS